MPYWQRLAVVGGVLLVTALIAKLIDRAITRRDLAPEVATRYRVLRRSIGTTVVVIGVLSALLVIPQVRAVAGAILASSAVIGLVVGFASQRTIGNFVAGLLIAFTQPVRLGDRVTIGDDVGTVEEIGMTYTFIRKDDNTRVVVPNEKIASDTILNSTIVSRDALAEITVQIPLSSDLEPVVALLRRDLEGERRGEVFVSDLADDAVLTIRAWAADAEAAERLESDLRVRAHARLRAAGVYA